MLAAGNVGVRQLVHQRDRRAARDDGVHVHFLEHRALVFDFLARDGIELRHEFGDAFAAVGFHDADDDVFAATVAADRLAEHAVGLADARRVAEKQLQHAFRFFRRRGDRQPLFRGLRHVFILFERRPESYDRMQQCARAF